MNNLHDPMDEPRYCGIPTFMRTPHITDLNELDIALLGIPYDGAVEARSGARQGPRQIRDMSSMMRKIHHVTRINPYALCRVGDVGDVHFNKIFDVEASHADISEFIEKLFWHVTFSFRGQCLSPIRMMPQNTTLFISIITNQGLPHSFPTSEWPVLLARQVVRYF